MTIYGKTFKCRICKFIYNYSYDPMYNKYEVCWACRDDIIPLHIPVNQRDQYMKVYIIKEELKKHEG